MTNKVK